MSDETTVAEESYMHHDPVKMVKALVLIAPRERLNQAVFAILDLMTDPDSDLDYCDFTEVITQMIAFGGVHISRTPSQDEGGSTAPGGFTEEEINRLVAEMGQWPDGDDPFESGEDDDHPF